MLNEERAVLVLALSDPWRAQELGRRINEYFHGSYEVLHTSTRAQTEQALSAAAPSGHRIAAVLADENLSDGSGLAMLREADGVPERGRLVLTDAAGPDANGREVDGVRQLPADPPGDSLWRSLEQALYETAPEDAVTAVVHGDPRKRAVHRVLRFLRLNAIPYTVEPPTGGAEVTVRIGEQQLKDPKLIVLAKALHLVVWSGLRTYDVIVVGGGPAGLSAAVNHAGLFGHKVLIVENQAPGGAAGTASNVIENYLGFPDGIKADELSQRSMRQALKANVEWLPAHRVVELSRAHPPGGSDDALEAVRRIRLGVKDDEGKSVELDAGAVLIACGVANRRQGGKNEQDYEGQGVYYTALPSDAENVNKDDPIVIVGAGDTAGRAALMFAAKEAKVTMVVRGKLRDSMLPQLAKQIEGSSHITVREQSNITEYRGEAGQLTGVVVNGNQPALQTRTAYILIGADPDTKWLEDAGVQVKRTKPAARTGYVVTDTDVKVAAGQPTPPALATNVPGVFAAGDVRFRGVRRISMAAGEGAAAALSVHNYFTGRPQLLQVNGDTANAALRAYYT